MENLKKQLEDANTDGEKINFAQLLCLVGIGEKDAITLNKLLWL